MKFFPTFMLICVFGRTQMVAVENNVKEDCASNADHDEIIMLQGKVGETLADENIYASIDEIEKHSGSSSEKQTTNRTRTSESVGISSGRRRRYNVEGYNKITWA